MNPLALKIGAVGACVMIGIGCAQVVAGNVDQPSRHTAAQEVQWGKTPFGPLASPISGNFAEGEHITFIKFPAGMKTPLHTHSHDYVGIVISGVTRHFTPGKPETKKPLPQGSHWFIPANLPHVSECLPGADCVMALYQANAMDFVPAQ